MIYLFVFFLATTTPLPPTDASGWARGKYDAVSHNFSTIAACESARHRAITLEGMGFTGRPRMVSTCATASESPTFQLYNNGRALPAATPAKPPVFDEKPLPPSAPAKPEWERAA